MKILSLITCALVVGCASPGASTADQAITATANSYSALDAAIKAADSAVKAGTLKGQDARNALKGLTDAKAGLDLALITLRSANAAAASASGVSK